MPGHHLNSKQTVEAEAAAVAGRALGLDRATNAHLAGVHDSTLGLWLSNDRDLRLRYDSAFAAKKKEVVAALLEGDEYQGPRRQTGLIFWLKMRCPEMFSEAQALRAMGEDPEDFRPVRVTLERESNSKKRIKQLEKAKKAAESATNGRGGLENGK